MTSPRTSLRDRLVLVLLCAISVIVLGCLLLRRTPPPEPLVNGRPISQWLNETTFPFENPISTEDRRALGPAAVRWLAYTAEHGGMGDQRPRTWIARQYAQFIDWARHRTSNTIDLNQEGIEGFLAFTALSGLRHDAAAAIPTLVRIIEQTSMRDFSEDSRANNAARTLASIGPDALPDYLRLIATRPSKARGLLVAQLAHSLDTTTLSETDRTKALAAFLSACHDEEVGIRDSALQGVAKFCSLHGFRPEMKPAVSATIALLSNPQMAERHLTYWMLGEYEHEASAAIPHLVQRLDDPSPYTASSAAMALASIDPADRRVIPHLRELLSSTNPNCRKFARTALQKLGEPLTDPGHPTVSE